METGAKTRTPTVESSIFGDSASDLLPVFRGQSYLHSIHIIFFFVYTAISLAPSSLVR